MSNIMPTETLEPVPSYPADSLQRKISSNLDQIAKDRHDNSKVDRRELVYVQEQINELQTRITVLIDVLEETRKKVEIKAEQLRDEQLRDETEKRLIWQKHKTFGEKIKERRKELKMTLEELGKKINSTKAYVWELQNKKNSRPSADKLLKIADALNISPEYLIDDSLKEQGEYLEDKAFFRKFKKLSKSNKKILKHLVTSISIKHM